MTGNLSAMELQIRPFEPGDVEMLERSLPSEDEAKFRRRLSEQQAGGIVGLVAWREGKPVGHAFVRWKPGAPLDSGLPGTPVVTDLAVAQDMQSKGIGTILMDEAERIIREAGYERVAIGVDSTNEGARRLYSRLGYRDSGINPVRSRGSFIDRSGTFRTHEGTLVHLVKDL